MGLSIFAAMHSGGSLLYRPSSPNSRGTCSMRGST